jgi:hypothetical protein
MLGMVLLFGGCPKRQTVSRVVYVPTTPSAQPQAPNAPDQDVLIIQEPQPPEEPAQATPPANEEAPAAEAPVRRHRRITKSEQADNSTDEDQKAVPELPAAEVPSLETRASPQQQNALRAQLAATQQQLQRRIDELSGHQLADEARKTLDNARVFLAQSQRAMEQNDLQRAQMLAEKAGLLVSSLEK